MSCPIEMVESRLKDISFPFSRVKIIPGFIEETLFNNNLPNKVCFAYVDVDFYKPTTVVLQFLDKHLSRNGFVVVDDYSFFSSGVKTAVEEFLADRRGNYELIMPYRFAGHFCILQKRPI